MPAQTKVVVEDLHESSKKSNKKKSQATKATTQATATKSEIPPIPQKDAGVPEVSQSTMATLPESSPENTQQHQALKLRPTGIPELEEMLGGGFPSKATVLLNGDAGVGKTTLAMQWLCNGFSKYAETGVYITLTEPTTVAIANLENRSFFKSDYIASADVNATQVESEIAARPGLHFVDLRQILEEMGLLKSQYTHEDIDKILEVLFGLVVNARVSRVVIDSITAIAYLLSEKTLIRTFIYKLGKFLAFSNANTVLIGEVGQDGSSIFGVEEFISDGVIQLRYIEDGLFPIRSLRIKKMRGIAFNSRTVNYKLTEAGIKIFLHDSKQLTHKASKQRVPTGIHGFDKLVSGGLLAESGVLISGPSGGGKTLFSIQTMVENLRRGHRSMYLSYEESRYQIIRNAAAFGWDLEAFENDGLLKIVTTHPDEMHIDELVHEAKSQIEEFKPTLVVVDSITAMGNIYEEKVVHEWTAQLVATFKIHGVLCMFLSATTNLVGESVASNVGISSLFDQIIMLRYVEVDSEFYHAVLVIKMRGSKHDKKMHRIEFTKEGLKVTQSFSGYEGVFSGNAKHISKSKEEKIHEVFLEVLGAYGQVIFDEQKEFGLQQTAVETLIQTMAEDGILDKHKEAYMLDTISSIYQGAV